MYVLYSSWLVNIPLLPRSIRRKCYEDSFNRPNWIPASGVWTYDAHFSFSYKRLFRGWKKYAIRCRMCSYTHMITLCQVFCILYWIRTINVYNPMMVAVISNQHIIKNDIHLKLRIACFYVRSFQTCWFKILSLTRKELFLLHANKWITLWQ